MFRKKYHKKLYERWEAEIRFIDARIAEIQFNMFKTDIELAKGFLEIPESFFEVQDKKEVK